MTEISKSEILSVRLTLSPIGIIKTPFTDRSRAPRQPNAEGAAAEGVITLNRGQNFEQALQDLDGVEKIWVLYWFHQNNSWKPKVLPPRGPRQRRGVFATRSPHRPNPLGLSLVTLLGVKGRTLKVSGADMLDGTPILDIKPYLPYAEAFPLAKTGWLEEVLAAEMNDAAAWDVLWSARAEQQAEWLWAEFGIELRSAADAVLRRDPTPHPYRRISKNGRGLQLALKSWRIVFKTKGKNVRVENIASGYSRSALKAGPSEKLHDGAAHGAFHRRWP